MAVYIPKARIREAAGDALKASHIGKLLHERSLLAQRPERDRYTVGWVPNIGAVDCYALRRSEFGRSEEATVPTPTSFIREGGMPDILALLDAAIGRLADTASIPVVPVQGGTNSWRGNS